MTERLSNEPQDYWARHAHLGVFTNWDFAGEEGLQRLSGPATFTAARPSDFRARLARVQLDHVAIEAFLATSHRTLRGDAEMAMEQTDMLGFVVVQEGRLRVRLSDSEFDVEAGELLILDSREPLDYETGPHVRMLRSIVGVEHIPQHLRQRGTTIRSALPRTPLLDSFTAFAVATLRSASAGHDTGDFLIRAIADLHAAVLAEAHHLTEEPTGAAGLRYRIEEYIEQHLTDPDLGPTEIAAALGISLRHAHGVFNEGQHTIARFVRERRLAAIALELRTARHRVSLDDLAATYCFSSAESMSRAFRERFGVPPREYRSSGHRAT